MIEVLEDLAPESRTDDVVARLVHPQCHAVEQYYSHAEALEPSEQELRKTYIFWHCKQDG